MPDILQDFFVAAPPDAVFEAVATGDGLDAWWTLTCAGDFREGSIIELGFGPEFQWKAKVAAVDSPSYLAIEFVAVDADWTGTRVEFSIGVSESGASVSFRHLGWRNAGEHFRVSAHCWALYLRLLRRFVEFGEIVEYEKRLTV